MAQNIKLDCFTLRIKKYNVDEYLYFDEVFTKKPIVFKNDAGIEDPLVDCSFYGFFEKYVNSFDNRFHTHKSTGKAICLDPNEFHLHKSQRIISGLVGGGSSDIGSKVKKKDKFDEDAFIITKEYINSVPFYYLLWVPENSNVGLLIVQSYSSKSVTEAVKAHLRQFFNKNISGYSLQIGTHIPKKVVKEMKEKGTIDKVILRKYALDADRSSNLFGAKYHSLNKLSIDIVVRGVSSIKEAKDAIMGLFSGETEQLIDIPDLRQLGFDEDYDILVEYEHNGRKALAKRSKNFDISPSVYIPQEEISLDIHNHPVYESIHSYSVSYLESVKEEIGYYWIIRTMLTPPSGTKILSDLAVAV